MAQDGAAQDLKDGVHQVRVVYSRPTRVLSVYLDASPVPSLWAELDPAELGLGPHPKLVAGFTATAPQSGEPFDMKVTRWTLHTTATDGAASTLLENGQVVGVAGEWTSVHIDARDSCKLPRSGGTDQWTATIIGPGAIAAEVRVIENLGDGTYRITFMPLHPGDHTLYATLRGGGQKLRAVFVVRR